MKKLVWFLLCAACFGQEIKRPTSDIDPGKIALGCTLATDVASTAMPNAYDLAGLTTSSLMSVSGDDKNTNISTRVFKSFSGTGNTYDSLTLNVSAGFTAQAPSNACLKYSVDGGVGWTTITCVNSTTAQQTYSVTLSAATDLTKLRVGACVQGGKGDSRAGVDPGSEDITIWDIWTAGTHTAANSGNGSGAGQPHREIVVVN